MWKSKDKNETTLNIILPYLISWTLTVFKIVCIHNKSMVMNIWTIKIYNCFQIYSYDKYFCKLVFQTQYLKVFSGHYHIAIQTTLFTVYYSNSKVYTVSYGLSCWLLYAKISSFENSRVMFIILKYIHFQKNKKFASHLFFQFQITIPIL